MGRGRQKAKQTKVARDLKYYSPETNYRALEQELASFSHHDASPENRRGAVETTDRAPERAWEPWMDDEDDPRWQGA